MCLFSQGKHFADFKTCLICKHDLKLKTLFRYFRGISVVRFIHQIIFSVFTRVLEPNGEKVGRSMAGCLCCFSSPCWPAFRCAFALCILDLLASIYMWFSVADHCVKTLSDLFVFNLFILAQMHFKLKPSNRLLTIQ